MDLYSPTCCKAGYKCKKYSEWFSQCIKNDKIVKKPITFWVLGDSTLSEFIDSEGNGSYYYKKYGYGTQLHNYFDDNVTIQNLAFSGASSKSFLELPNYQTFLEGIKSGDYLTFGFGHNDEKREEARFTDPNGDYKTKGSFANSLYENYIKIAMERNATVILTTPIVRRTDDPNWTSSKLHITTDKDGYPGGDYPQAIRDLGKELNIPVIDMTVITKDLYDSFGVENTLNLHAWKNSDPSSVDNTHLNSWGSKYIAYIFTRMIKKDNIAGLGDRVLEAEVPIMEECLVINPDYVEPTTN
ncbi:carbohydrate esterase family 12 protein [Piromyces sp. E2]|nr:carbohydrate esterase family 12 protein [Piromyces sp. E2]|eukprot:OUM67894.1 carbohydrate esterase family 12 protein [Piromyces sp. E2]